MDVISRLEKSVGKLDYATELGIELLALRVNNSISDAEIQNYLGIDAETLYAVESGDIYNNKKATIKLMYFFEMDNEIEKAFGKKLE